MKTIIINYLSLFSFITLQVKGDDQFLRRPITTSTAELPPEENEDVEVNPLVVEITTGKIEGRKLETIDLKKTYYAYQGIPYAKPPLEGLRFKEPLPPEKWNKTLKTHADGPKCIQISSFSGSEDCLYLNVYSPKENNPVFGEFCEDEDKDKSKLPVMVWIYGGAFVKGSSAASLFGPDYFLEENVIVVSFNYRVGIFGFLSTEDYAATGNWGIKDQILSLKWVQDNIHKFGGDPNNVTVFGESAGAVSVSVLLQSPLSRGLFQKAIMQSGTSLNPWAHAKNPRKSAFIIAKLLDIATEDTNIMVDQLRRVDYRTLHIASISADLKETIFQNALDGLVFAPSTEVNHPGAVLTNNSHSILKMGDFHRIPVIVGFNSAEAVGATDALRLLKAYLATYDIFASRIVPGSLNIKRYLRKVAVAQQIRSKYFGFRPIVFSTGELVEFITDDQFVRPIYEYIRQSSKYTTTYFYVFGYEGPLGVDGADRSGKGVGHAEENNYLWNRDTNIDNVPDTDLLTRRRLLRLWTNFAKTGNPTPVRDKLLQNVTWPPTNFNTMVYLNITSDLKLDNNADDYNIEFWDDIFKNFGNPPYDTY